MVGQGRGELQRVVGVGHREGEGAGGGAHAAGAGCGGDFDADVGAAVGRVAAEGAGGSVEAQPAGQCAAAVQRGAVGQVVGGFAQEVERGGGHGVAAAARAIDKGHTGRNAACDRRQADGLAVAVDHQLELAGGGLVGGRSAIGGTDFDELAAGGGAIAKHLQGGCVELEARRCSCGGIARWDGGVGLGASAVEGEAKSGVGQRVANVRVAEGVEWNGHRPAAAVHHRWAHACPTHRGNGEAAGGDVGLVACCFGGEHHSITCAAGGVVGVGQTFDGRGDICCDNFAARCHGGAVDGDAGTAVSAVKGQGDGFGGGGGAALCLCQRCDGALVRRKCAGSQVRLITVSIGLNLNGGLVTARKREWFATIDMPNSVVCAFVLRRVKRLRHLGRRFRPRQVKRFAVKNEA